MRHYAWTIGLMMMFHPAYPSIYKWTDSSGNVHFSDKPSPGAQEIELPKTQTYSTPNEPSTDNEKNQVTEDGSKGVGEDGANNVAADGSKDESFVYDKLAIIQPEDQVTIRNTDGSVSVIVSIEPNLRRGDKLQLMVDGAPLGKLKATTEFSLRGIKRGSHTLAVQVVNGEGAVLNTSKTITLFMMPPRVNMGNINP